MMQVQKNSDWLQPPPDQQSLRRYIEAIRMHAARTGELPAALDQLSVVPAPANPFTGRPFDYRLMATS